MSTTDRQQSLVLLPHESHRLPGRLGATVGASTFHRHVGYHLLPFQPPPPKNRGLGPVHAHDQDFILPGQAGGALLASRGLILECRPTDHAFGGLGNGCLLYTSDAADEEDSVDLGGRRIIKKKKKKYITYMEEIRKIKNKVIR
eukprot:TRINITY_DN9500_c0_g1_i4.p1 TRINITY_DN9500_c0_g1~~TRINITY_DN9500_c0_g1_i4.p1  ORF type:complete len:144 (+),score=22.56 TRINITY_DN9500_c0_g1_i4:530-961(+)